MSQQPVDSLVSSGRSDQQCHRIPAQQRVQARGRALDRGAGDHVPPVAAAPSGSGSTVSASRRRGSPTAAGWPPRPRRRGRTRGVVGGRPVAPAGPVAGEQLGAVPAQPQRPRGDQQLGRARASTSRQPAASSRASSSRRAAKSTGRRLSGSTSESPTARCPGRRRARPGRSAAAASGRASCDQPAGRDPVDERGRPRRHRSGRRAPRRRRRARRSRRPRSGSVQLVRSFASRAAFST